MSTPRPGTGEHAAIPAAALPFTLRAHGDVRLGHAAVLALSQATPKIGGTFQPGTGLP